MMKRRDDRRGRRLICCGMIVALTPLSCGGSILGDDPETGLAVTVTRGPIMPVAREGEINSEPVSGALVRVERIDGGGHVERRTDSAGTAELSLEPGRYSIHVVECPTAMRLPPADEAVVAPGHIETVLLECDTGIR